MNSWCLFTKINGVQAAGCMRLFTGAGALPAPLSLADFPATTAVRVPGREVASVCPSSTKYEGG